MSNKDGYLQHNPATGESLGRQKSNQEQRCAHYFFFQFRRQNSSSAAGWCGHFPKVELQSTSSEFFSSCLGLLTLFFPPPSWWDSLSPGLSHDLGLLEERGERYQSPLLRLFRPRLLCVIKSPRINVFPRTRQSTVSGSATYLENISKIILQIIPNSFMKKNVVSVYIVLGNYAAYMLYTCYMDTYVYFILSQFLIRSNVFKTNSDYSFFCVFILCCIITNSLPLHLFTKCWHKPNVSFVWVL